MSSILRKIRKGRWLNLPSGRGPNEVPGDALLDLGTSADQLSVWMVAEGLGDLENVILTLASNGQFVSNIDYVLCDAQEIAFARLDPDLTNDLLSN